MDAIFGFNWAGVVEFLPALARGLYYTLLVSVGGLVIGFVLGAIAGLARLSRFKVVNWIAIIYIEAVRGTPVLVQAIWIYFADRKSTRLNSSHVATSYAVFCLRTKMIP